MEAMIRFDLIGQKIMLFSVLIQDIMGGEVLVIDPIY